MPCCRGCFLRVQTVPHNLAAAAGCLLREQDHSEGQSFRNFAQRMFYWTLRSKAASQLQAPPDSQPGTMCMRKGKAAAWLLRRIVSPRTQKFQLHSHFAFDSQPTDAGIEPTSKSAIWTREA